MMKEQQLDHSLEGGRLEIQAALINSPHPQTQNFSKQKCGYTITNKKQTTPTQTDLFFNNKNTDTKRTTTPTKSYNNKNYSKTQTQEEEEEERERERERE
jgi:Tfp pilus assembly major pilin PilA